MASAGKYLCSGQQAEVLGDWTTQQVEVATRQEQVASFPQQLEYQHMAGRN